MKELILKRGDILLYSLLCLVTILIFFFVYRNWGLVLSVPYFYRGDSLWNLAFIKGFVDNNSFNINNFIGMPFGSNLYDYPSADSIFKTWVFFCSQITNNPVIILNVYYIFTYILASFSSFFVLRYFKISTNISFFASLVISFLPYHCIKGEGHVNLSAYYLIPFLILASYWLYLGILHFSVFKKKSPRIKNKLFFGLLILFLIANNGVYYAYFSLFILLLSGTLGAFKKKNVSVFLTTIFLTTFLAITLFINFIPNIKYQKLNGVNKIVAVRGVNEAEYYGLKTIELFIPNSNYHFDLLRKFKERYYALTYTKSEIGSSYLGFIGIIGFIILIANLFTKVSFNKKLDYLSYLNLWSIMLAVTGGLGTIISYSFFSQIRVYSRLSIFIAIYSVFAFSIVLDRFIVKLNLKKKFIFNILLIVLFVFVLIDQGKIKETNAAGNKRLYQSDQLFVQAIEMVVPENSMIYQLPYKQFPETPNINKLTDYDLFREYIHSNSLKWSYGAIKGREGDNWLKAVSELPLESMIQKIALAGFKGIAFDRVAYLDNGTELENKISTILDQKAIVSSMGDLVFFSLTDYYENLVNKYTQDELQIITSKALAFPVQILWKDGFYEEETDGLDSWRWAKQVATIELNNSNAEDKTVKITFRLATGSPEYSSIEISGLIEDSKNVNNKANFIEKKINVPPGMSEINFISGAKQLVDDLDKRSLFFRIYDFNIKEL